MPSMTARVNAMRDQCARASACHAAAASLCALELGPPSHQRYSQFSRPMGFAAAALAKTVEQYRSPGSGGRQRHFEGCSGTRLNLSEMGCALFARVPCHIICLASAGGQVAPGATRR